MSDRPRPDPGSFRDPAGRVFVSGNRVFRRLSTAGADRIRALLESGVLQLLIQEGRVIGTEVTHEQAIDQGFSESAGEIPCILEHTPLPLITYPYEWSFETLRAAALAHLDLHLRTLAMGYTLADASAFNMQFDGTQPVHIDVLSIVPYTEGAHWIGYGQFLRQFLNPLVFEAEYGVSFASWYRGSLDGLTSEELYRVLPWHRKIRPGYFMHIGSQAIYDRRATKRVPKVVRAKLRPLPKSRLISLLSHLRNVVVKLPSPHDRNQSWAEYEEQNSYSHVDTAAKHRFAADFVESAKPKVVLDIGCNTGAFSLTALNAGAQRIFGLETDRAALDASFLRAAKSSLNFLPLAIDVANPSPAQGWRGIERASIVDRLSCDAVLALAILHHLVFRNNIPIADATRFISSLAPCCLIEFVPKEDPQVAKLLRYRDDIFSDYTEEAFRAALSSVGCIVSEVRLTSGRLLIRFEREGKVAN